MKRVTNLRGSLPAHPWRLVAHIPEIQLDAGLSTIVGAILEINSATEAFLINKAGLIDGTPPESFTVFMHYSTLLRAAWDHGGELVPDDVKPRLVGGARSSLHRPDNLRAEIVGATSTNIPCWSLGMRSLGRLPLSSGARRAGRPARRTP
jgi:hypothetical protein